MDASDLPDTVTEALEVLRTEGYTADFELVDGALCSGPVGASTTCAIAEAVVERLYRFEGPSDPGDEMVVFGLLDPTSGTRGTLASAFGHGADPELATHLSDLRRRFRPG